jgi:hypothetical protein
MVQDASEKLTWEEIEKDTVKGHILPSVLWNYSKRKGTLDPVEAQHLTECQDCVAILLLCRACKSLEQLKTKLRELAVIIKRRDG